MHIMRCYYMTFSTNILPLNLYGYLYTKHTPDFNEMKGSSVGWTRDRHTLSEKETVSLKISFKIHCQTIHYSFYFEYIFTLNFWRCCHRYCFFSLYFSFFVAICCKIQIQNSKCEWQWSVGLHNQFVACVVNMHPNFLYKYCVLFILANSLLLNSCIISLFITHLFKRFIAHIKRVLLYFVHLKMFESKKRRFWN